MSTKLHTNVAMIDRHRALWKERDEWDVCQHISTEGLIEALRERELSDDQWHELADIIGEQV